MSIRPTPEGVSLVQSGDVARPARMGNAAPVVIIQHYELLPKEAEGLRQHWRVVGVMQLAISWVVPIEFRGEPVELPPAASMPVCLIYLILGRQRIVRV